MGAQFAHDVIPLRSLFYARDTVSCRGPSEILAERGVAVDHATFIRRVAASAALIAANARCRTASNQRSWRIGKTHTRLKGERLAPAWPSTGSGSPRNSLRGPSIHIVEAAPHRRARCFGLTTHPVCRGLGR
jgi:hypothetical protein